MGGKLRFVRWENRWGKRRALGDLNTDAPAVRVVYFIPRAVGFISRNPDAVMILHEFAGVPIPEAKRDEAST